MHLSRLNIRKILIPITLLSLLAFLIRIIPVITGEVHFSFDQGLDILMTSLLITSHELNLISRYSGLQGVMMGPLWTYFLSIPFILFSGNPAGNVFFLSFFSVSCAIVSFFLFKKILPKSVAWLTFLFMLFSPHFVGTSQIVLSPHPIIYIFPFFLYFCYEIFFLKNQKFWIFLGLLVGILFQLEIAFAVFTLPTLVVLFLLTKSFVSLRSKYFYFGIVLLLATFIPQMIFDLRHNFLITGGLLSFFSGEKNSLYGHAIPFSDRFSERVKTIWEDFTSMAIFIRPIYLTVLSIAMAIFGWVKIIVSGKQSEKNFLLILLTILGTFFVGFLFYPGAVWSWYRAGLPIVYILLFTIPLGILIRQNSILKIVVIAVLFITLAQALQSAQIQTLFRSDLHSGVASLKGQKQILDFIYNDASGQKFNYYAYTPPVYDYIWQYEFLWYGNQKYQYVPDNLGVNIPLLGIGKQAQIPDKINSLTYLIVEPDSERPLNAREWEKKYARAGRVVFSKKFPSNIIVERLEVSK